MRAASTAASVSFALLAIWTLRAEAAQGPPALPDSVRLELTSIFFMNEALDLLERQPTQENGRRQIEALANPIQFMGSQTRGDQVTEGYVARIPETFVSVTLFYDRVSETLTTVHVVMSPGMWSRAERMIEGSFDLEESARIDFGDKAYLLGIENIERGAVRISLSEQASGLGIIYAINYELDDQASINLPFR